MMIMPTPPLGGTEPRVDAFGGVTMTEVVDTALASYAARLGQEKQAQAALKAATGATPPAPVRATLGKMEVFWTGPDQWMIMAPHERNEDLASQIKAKAGDAASVTEQNDAWCRFDLTGPRLADVFERLCPVNLRAGSEGDATRTSIDHLGCFVIHRGAERITVLGPRSSAGSLHHALLTAMHSAL